MKENVKGCLKDNALTLFTLLGVFIGLGLGFGLLARDEPWSQREAMYIEFVGILFLNMLKCIIIPLIIPSLIVAVGSLDVALSGKVKFYNTFIITIKTLFTHKVWHENNLKYI